MFKGILMQIRKPFYFISIILAVLLASGCSQKKSLPSKNRMVNVKENRVEKALKRAAVSIQDSLEVLAKAQESKEPALIDTLPLITPEGGMGGEIDIDWTGPIAPLIYKLATLTNYNLKIFGNEPAIPVIVTISKKKAIIADVLKNAGLQARNRASIVVFPENRVIELRYKSI